ncbi:hypothetical protein [Streptomyces sp. NPDC001880]
MARANGLPAGAVSQCALGRCSAGARMGHATWLGATDVLGHAEYRLLGVLDKDERTLLNDMLRRVMPVAEDRGDAAWD